MSAKSSKTEPKPGTRSPDKNKNQGEGNTEAARRYNESSHEFVHSKEGQRTVDEHPIKSTEEGHQAEYAEEKAKRRAKERDPQETRDYASKS